MSLMDERPQETQHYATPELVLLVPRRISFNDLKLELDSEGALDMDTSVMLEVLGASNICPNCFFNNADMASHILNIWYTIHLQLGGDRNQVMDDLRAEADFQRAAGDKFVHAPGHA